MSRNIDADAKVRLAAFEFLKALNVRHEDVLPRTVLEQGFVFEGQRVPLVGPQGIFKPAVLREIPLSITTVPIVEGRARPYDDEVRDDGIIVYRYRGTNVSHHENVGLRRAMTERVPLIYFHGLVPGRYAAAFPTYIVGDDPRGLCFHVQVDQKPRLEVADDLVADDDSLARRAYVTAIVQRRLHQEAFRQRVVRAYRRCCSVCRLGHEELLDAAHILPDRDQRSEPRISSGLSLCKIHHAAFDRGFLGIRPDLIVEVRKDILLEDDGPMLVHGLQECHGRSLRVTPQAEKHKPNKDFLSERYQRFLDAG